MKSNRRAASITTMSTRATDGRDLLIASSVFPVTNVSTGYRLPSAVRRNSQLVSQYLRRPSSGAQCLTLRTSIKLNTTGQVCPITRFIPENRTEFYKIRYGALQTTNWPRALRYFTTVPCLHDNWPRRTMEQRRVLGYWNTCRWHGEEISNSITVRLS